MSIAWIEYRTNRAINRLLDNTGRMRKNPDLFKWEPVYDPHESFYGKARACVHDDGTLTLISYDTMVMDYNPETHEFRRSLYQPQSRTTMRHMLDFYRAMSNNPDATGDDVRNLPTW